MEQYDVVIVGAGPVGLSLALGLARAGRRVQVLEQRDGPAEHSRAPAIWPGTQSVLAELGVLPDFLARGMVLPRLALHDADRHRTLLSLPLAELRDETPWPQLLIVPQSATERLLAAALARYPTATLCWRCSVDRVDNLATGIVAGYTGPGGATDRREVAASFLVGCDGAHSTVRTAIGAELRGITYELRAALADVALDGLDHLAFPRLTTRGRLAVGIRIDPGTWRLIMPFTNTHGIDLTDRVAGAVRHLFAGVMPPAEQRFRVLWQSEFTLHQRMASKFVECRVALAGDAAHLNSPVGGQGMNAGIQDTRALVAALQQGLDSGTAAPLLDYQRLRRSAVGEGVNTFTDRLTRPLLAGGGRHLKALLAAASVLLSIPPLRHRVLRSVAMLDVA